MLEVTQEGIYSRFPWVKPVSLDFEDSEEGYFYDVPDWSFNQSQLVLIFTMLEEVESWFQKHDKPYEIIIIEFKEIQGHVLVEKICGFSEVDDIFEKYSAICMDSCKHTFSLSKKVILQKFPWATERSLFDKIETQTHLNDSIEWNLDEKQLQLVVMLFGDIEEWFESKKKKIDIDIYFVGELFDRLHIEFISNTREVHLMIDKYKQFSLELLKGENELYEEKNYDDIF